MKKYIVIFNPLANNKKGEEGAKALNEILNDDELDFYDITQIEDYNNFFNEIVKGNELIICGGDGTINRFVNNVDEKLIKSINLYYFATGTGNDLFNDIKDNEKSQNGIYLLNKYITDLPTVEVNGNKYKFINGIGYGIDGYCCEVGDKLRERTTQKINYTSIAIKGLLFHYKPTNAKVNIDGKKYEFNKVWIAPTMNGRFYGGGMMSAPTQDRLNKDREVSFVVMSGKGRLKTLTMFPSIFKGEHLKYDSVKLIKGKEVTVEFDRPVALQIDGETILNVTKYKVTSSAKIKN